MREVYADIARLGINSGDKVTFTLYDHMGNICKKPMFTQTITATNDEVRAELLENDTLCIDTYYNLTLPSNVLTFQVFSSLSPYPLDIMALVFGGCHKGIVNMYEKTLDKEYVKKFEKFLIGENPHFKKSEEKFTCRYVDYANNGHHTKKAIDDVAFVMDGYISQIGLTNG